MVQQSGFNTLVTECRGIYTDSNFQTTLMLRNNNPYYKSSNLNTNNAIYDIAFVVVSDSGSIIKVVDVSNAQSSNAAQSFAFGESSPFYGHNMLRTSGNYYIWSGQSYGFYTSYQDQTFVTSGSNRYNTLTYKFQFDVQSTYDCVQNSDISTSQITSLCKKNSLISFSNMETSFGMDYVQEWVYCPGQQ